MNDTRENRNLDTDTHHTCMDQYESLVDIPDYNSMLSKFCEFVNNKDIPEEDTTTSKKIGTYFENELRDWMESQRGIESDGSIAEDEDIPELNLDVKATSESQPQSSIPMKYPLERITGMQYDVLVFIYKKDRSVYGNKIDVVNCSYIPKERTGDHRKSEKARELIHKYKNEDISRDILKSRIEELTGLSHFEGIELVTEEQLDDMIQNPPKKGAMTVSAAAQWRPSYNQMTKSDEGKEFEKIYDNQ